MNKAVFIDKDGTLITDVPYNVDPVRVALEEHAGQALQTLKKNEYYLIVISNQSGVAKGFFSEADLQQVNSEIQRRLRDYHVQIDAFYYCPHLQDGIVEEYAVDCNCRKPKPGLLMQAAKDFDIDVSKSWMIGDILNDVEAGNDAGCKTILLDNGNETEWLITEKRLPHYRADNLQEAASIITEGNR